MRLKAKFEQWVIEGTTIKLFVFVRLVVLRSCVVLFVVVILGKMRGLGGKAILHFIVKIDVSIGILVSLFYLMMGR